MIRHGLSVHPRCSRTQRAHRLSPIAGDARSVPALPELADITLPDQDGAPVRIGDLWADGPVALVWLRHYG